MNDGRDISSVSSYAVNAVLERIDPLLREIPGVVASKDPEYLHRMRVASRRLRMALRLLRGETGLSCGEAFYKLVRNVTRSLGEARDLDVQIAWTREFEGFCRRDERAGVRRVGLRLRQRRVRIQPRVVNAVTNLPHSPIFTKALQELRASRLEAEIAGKPADGGDMERGTRVMLLQLEGVVGSSVSLESPEAANEQHRMRIEVKHLRYMMEIFGGFYEDGLDEYISIAKKLQGVLGALHDADVWITEIPRMMEKERARTLRYYGTSRPFSRLVLGYEAISEDRRDSRERVYTESRDLWRKSVEEGRWQALRELLLVSCRR